MGHIPEKELLERVKSAKKNVEVGARYTHYKHPELTYLVTGLAIWEATDEVVVRYEAQYGERVTYARPLVVWEETVLWNGEEVPRFSKVSATNS